MNLKLRLGILCAIALACAQMLAPSRAWACSCAAPPTAQDALRSADAVFLGKVLRITQVLLHSTEGTYVQNSVLFEVSSTWKGVSRSNITLMTGIDGGGCGYVFSVGETYLVYAHSDDERPSVLASPFGMSTLRTSLCSRTAPLAHAGQDLAVLGAGSSPQDPTPLEQLKDALPYFVLCLILAAAFLVIRRIAKRKPVL